MSGRAIEVTSIPSPGGRCHFDRAYHFISLGDFDKPSMRYVYTSNEDRKTSNTQVMWVLDMSVPCTVHINFRSQHHVDQGGAERWLASGGWEINPTLRSAVSSGIPNGPYSGPVYTKACEPGRLNLMGSNTWEGTYFVFIDLGQ